jgi:uncharacterized protein YycO
MAGDVYNGLSHVDCVLPDGRLLGSRSDRKGNVEAGVQIRPPAYAKWRVREVIELRTTKRQEERLYKFLHKQIGKPYDRIGILGWVTGRSWRDDDSWYCSELQTAALEYARIIPKLYVPTYKITPETLAIIMSAIGGKVVDPGV